MVGDTVRGKDPNIRPLTLGSRNLDSEFVAWGGPGYTFPPMVALAARSTGDDGAARLLQMPALAFRCAGRQAEAVASFTGQLQATVPTASGQLADGPLAWKP